MNKLLWIVIPLCLIIAIVLLIYHTSSNPYVTVDTSFIKTIYETKLEMVPSKVVYNNSNDCFILFEDGVAQKTQIKDGKICFSDSWDDVSLISSENNISAIVNIEGEFYFDGKNISDRKVLFEKSVNIKALESEIIKVVSAYNFTAVLFGDGSVYSDIGYINENDYKESDDFRIFKNYYVKDIFASTCQIIALCENEELIQCLYVQNQDCKYKKMLVGKGEKITNVCFYNGCLVTTDLKQTYLFKDMFTTQDEIYGIIIDEYSDYSIVDSSTYDWGLFLLSDDNALYYKGYTFAGAPIERYGGYEMIKRKIYSGNDLKYFFCLKGGIVIILNDGTTQLIVC